jgi:drug/metabolite transporter (DMT)-like permease
MDVTQKRQDEDLLRKKGAPHINLKKFIPIILLADLMIALQGASVKGAADYFTPNFIVFARFSLNFLFFLVWMVWKKRGKALFRTHAWKKHLVRSLCGVASIYGFYVGLVYLPLAPTMLLFFSFPICTPLVTRIWLKNRILTRLWWGIGISFMGLILMLKPGSEVFNFYGLIPLTGAVLAAVAGVAIRQLHYTDSSDTILAYFFLTGVVVSGIFELIPWDGREAIFNGSSLLLILMVGIFSTAFQGLYTLAARYAPARLLSPFLYLSFIFTAIEDWIIWSLPLSIGLVIGFVLILCGTALYIWMYPKNSK